MANTAALSPAVIVWLEQALGGEAKIEAVTLAKGATSSSVYFVTAMVSGRVEEFVLRLFTNADWLAEEPDLATHEAAVLEKMVGAGLPAPELVACAADESACGIPAILMRRMAGSVELRPDDFDDWLAQMAAGLAKVHAVSADGFGWGYFSWTDKEDLKPPTWSRHPQLWEQAIQLGLADPPDYEPVFLHRDYHPTNILWQSGNLSAIVDWVNGCRGPASVDLAHCRINLMHMYGPQVAEQFLETYWRIVGPGFVHHPYWDIDSILDTLPDPGFYPPWLDFGLRPIAQEVLRSRADDYLGLIMRNLL